MKWKSTLLIWFLCEMVSLPLQSVHMKTMSCLLPMASMKPHLLVNQLVWAQELDVVVHLVEVHQDLQLPQGTFWLLSCWTVLLHHVGFVLLDECVDVLRVLHKWLLRHPHVLVQSLQMQRNHDQSLMLQKNNELVAVVDSVWQELMWSEVEHSLTMFDLPLQSPGFPPLPSSSLPFLPFFPFPFPFPFFWKYPYSSR